MINCRKWMLTNKMEKYLANFLKRSPWSYLGLLKKKKTKSYVVFALSNLTQPIKVG
jgi:hypothetical protein